MTKITQERFGISIDANGIMENNSTIRIIYVRINHTAQANIFPSGNQILDNKPAPKPKPIEMGITGRIRTLTIRATIDSLPNWNRIKGRVNIVADSVAKNDSLI